jgi:hypothetical protein
MVIDLLERGHSGWSRWERLVQLLPQPAVVPASLVSTREGGREEWECSCSRCTRVGDTAVHEPFSSEQRSNTGDSGPFISLLFPLNHILNRFLSARSSKSTSHFADERASRTYQQLSHWGSAAPNQRIFIHAVPLCCSRTPHPASLDVTAMVDHVPSF